jgi:hypothetical protein
MFDPLRVQRGLGNGTEDDRGDGNASRHGSSGW